MGRRAEPGIKYYPMKCDHLRNKKIRLLMNEAGEGGYWVWQCILATAYENKGYYFDCNDKDALALFAFDVCRKRVSQVEEIIAGCIRRSLFDRRVFDMFGVLTSAEMQDVYLEATAERRRKGTIVEMKTEYLLLQPDDAKRWENVQFIGEKIVVPRNNQIIPRKNENDPVNNPQSKVKESKEEETIAGKPVPPAVAPADPGNDLEKEYSQIGKDKKSVYLFLKERRPLFIQPYVDFWNIFAGEHSLPKVTTVNKKRRQHFAVRIKEPNFNFPEILRKAKTSDFLLTGSWFGFDWLIKNDTNYLKVLEGNYDNKKQESQSNAATEEYIKKRQVVEQRTRDLENE